MNRRCFVRQITTASAGIASGGLVLGATGCLGFHYLAATPSPDGLIVQKKDLGDKRFALIEAPTGRHPIYLYRQDDGNFVALSTRCTHRGCTVEPASDHLECPCHGSEFTNTGEVTKGPADAPLTRYQTRETTDTVVIAWVGEPAQR